MLMMNLGEPTALQPAAMPTSGSRWRMGSTSAVTAQTLAPHACGYGYVAGPGGVCMSQGCMDGRSPCVVVDSLGRTCSYDQLLAYQSQSGTPNACGPAPQLPPPPQVPSVPPPPNVMPGIPQPGMPVDVSPNPGTQVTATMPMTPDTSVYPIAGFQVPKWALVLGGLTIIGIVIAVFARR